MVSEYRSYADSLVPQNVLSQVQYTSQLYCVPDGIFNRIWQCVSYAFYCIIHFSTPWTKSVWDLAHTDVKGASALLKKVTALYGGDDTYLNEKEKIDFLLHRDRKKIDVAADTLAADVNEYNFTVEEVRTAFIEALKDIDDAQCEKLWDEHGYRDRVLAKFIGEGTTLPVDEQVKIIDAQQEGKIMCVVAQVISELSTYGNVHYAKVALEEALPYRHGLSDKQVDYLKSLIDKEFEEKIVGEEARKAFRWGVEKRDVLTAYAVEALTDILGIHIVNNEMLSLVKRVFAFLIECSTDSEREITPAQVGRKRAEVELAENKYKERVLAYLDQSLTLAVFDRELGDMVPNIKRYTASAFKEWSQIQLQIEMFNLETGNKWDRKAFIEHYYEDVDIHDTSEDLNRIIPSVKSFIGDVNFSKVREVYLVLDALKAIAEDLQQIESEFFSQMEGHSLLEELIDLFAEERDIPEEFRDEDVLPDLVKAVVCGFAKDVLAIVAPEENYDIKLEEGVVEEASDKLRKEIGYQIAVAILDGNAHLPSVSSRGTIPPLKLREESLDKVRAHLRTFAFPDESTLTDAAVSTVQTVGAWALKGLTSHASGSTIASILESADISNREQGASDQAYLERLSNGVELAGLSEGACYARLYAVQYGQHWAPTPDLSDMMQSDTKLKQQARAYMEDFKDMNPKMKAVFQKQVHEILRIHNRNLILAHIRGVIDQKFPTANEYVEAMYKGYTERLDDTDAGMRLRLTRRAQRKFPGSLSAFENLKREHFNAHARKYFEQYVQ